MLYVEINTFEAFCKVFPASRARHYSHDGLKALFEYWEGEAERDDIKVNEELDYSACEYDSARKALSDIDPNRLRELELDCAWAAMERAGYDPEPGMVEAHSLLETWADDTDPEELEELALEALPFYCEHAAQLANGGVLVIRN